MSSPGPYASMAVEMALYSQWQTASLFECCDRLSDAERRLDRGMFFASIHGTLNHLLYVDGVLVRFIESGLLPVEFDPNTVVAHNYDELRAHQLDMGERVLELFRNATVEWFAQSLTYHSDELGLIRVRPRALFIQQMFNHQTHHRSQITSVLHRMGLDYGSTDLPANPLSQW